MYWKPVLITPRLDKPRLAARTIAARWGRVSPFDRQIYGAVQIGHDYSKPQVKTPTIRSDFLIF